METALPAFTPIEESLFLTQCGRALDHRSPHPNLADAMADEIVRKLDYDCGWYRLSASPVINITLRTKNLTTLRGGSSPVTLTRSRSTWVPGWTPGRFASPRRPSSIGTTSTSPRSSPHDGNWYRIARIPRRGRGPDRSGLAGRDPHRPAVIVADGLLAFLARAEMVSLLKRLTGHFPFGEVAFNGYSRFVIWAAKRYHGTQSVAAFIKSPGFDDPREPERWDAGLKLVEEIPLTRDPDVAEFPLALRAANRLAARSATWSRRGTTVLH